MKKSNISPGYSQPLLHYAQRNFSASAACTAVKKMLQHTQPNWNQENLQESQLHKLNNFKMQPLQLRALVVPNLDRTVLTAGSNQVILRSLYILAPTLCVFIMCIAGFKNELYCTSDTAYTRTNSWAQDLHHKNYRCSLASSLVLYF